MQFNREVNKLQQQILFFRLYKNVYLLISLKEGVLQDVKKYVSIKEIKIIVPADFHLTVLKAESEYFQ